MSGKEMLSPDTDTETLDTDSEAPFTAQPSMLPHRQGNTQPHRQENAQMCEDCGGERSGRVCRIHPINGIISAEEADKYCRSSRVHQVRSASGEKCTETRTNICTREEPNEDQTLRGAQGTSKPAPERSFDRRRLESEENTNNCSQKPRTVNIPDSGRCSGNMKQGSHHCCTGLEMRQDSREEVSQSDATETGSKGGSWLGRLRKGVERKPPRVSEPGEEPSKNTGERVRSRSCGSSLCRFCSGLAPARRLHKQNDTDDTQKENSHQCNHPQCRSSNNNGRSASSGCRPPSCPKARCSPRPGTCCKSNNCRQGVSDQCDRESIRDFCHRGSVSEPYLCDGEECEECAPTRASNIPKLVVGAVGVSALALVVWKIYKS